MKTDNDFIGVKRVKEEKKSESGLLLSDQDKGQMRYERAEVILENENYPNIKIGMHLYFDKVHGFDGVFDGQDLTLIRRRDIAIFV